MIISVQTEDFSVSDVVLQLTGSRRDVGAVVTFSGLVRDQSDNQDLQFLELEHYPGMTEKSLQDIADQAMNNWDVHDLAIIHRVGKLAPQDNIVLVVTLSAHRQDAFEACAFLMDYLKTRAPFWKKEISRQGEHWVAARSSDDDAAEQWQDKLK